MTSAEHLVRTQVLLDNRGAIQIKQQQFALNVLILHSRSISDQVAYGIVTVGFSIGRAFAVPAVQQGGQPFKVELSGVSDVRKDAKLACARVLSACWFIHFGSDSECARMPLKKRNATNCRLRLSF
ncbi:hypothetical protein [Marinobacter sp.]|uniref:hypothetical protein n=1 Tax=Marinobacter sp. TaxID=50741 RepID=UPI003A911780